ncbi:MAG TPA: sigma-70 family RNA polymerase sigma factor [Gaiellaceae bacterium]|nr:sigma-70 family RNA polymerase sigma factor [Gaiellaceae bacterium]
MRLHEEHFEAVRRYAWRRDPEIADDITAETFAVAWRRLDDVPDDARPWLIGVARHARLNVRRSQRRQANVVAALERAHVPADVAGLGAGELMPELEAALRALAPADREVLLLHAWDELGSAEIAVALGCSKANASLRLHRAKRRFEKAFAARRREAQSTHRSSTAHREGVVDGY